MNRVHVIESHLLPTSPVAALSHAVSHHLRVERRGPVGVLTMCYHGDTLNPALTAPLRRALLEGLELLTSTATTTAVAPPPPLCCIILTSDSTRIFSTGFDRLDMGSALQLQPTLAELTAAIANSPVPVVAAINGTCYSWGLELALACRYRLASPHSLLSFPEVQLGLVPCGGGSQRLTRLVGVRCALDMLCTSRQMPAPSCLDLGLVDAVVAVHPRTESFVEACITRAQKWTSGGAPPHARPRLEEDRSNLGYAVSNHALFQWATRKVRERAPRGLASPYRAIDAVRLATANGSNFEAGAAAERTLCKQMLTQPHAQALQHIFSAASVSSARPGHTSYPAAETTAAAAAVAATDAAAAALPFKKVAVLGIGVVGTSVVMMLLNESDVQVVAVEPDAMRLERVRQNVRSALQSAVDAKSMTSFEMDHILDRVEFHIGGGGATEGLPEVLQEVDLVVECAPEILSDKVQLFTQLDAYCKPACVLVTSTSSLSVSELAEVVAPRHAGRMVGLYFFPPANRTSLVEVSAPPCTCPEVLAQLTRFLQGLRKYSVLNRAGSFHASMRLMMAALYQAYDLLETGAFPHEIDSAVRKLAHCRVGLFEMADLVGLDVLQHARLTGAVSLPKRNVYTIADALCAEGKLGRKVGEGWYQYEHKMDGMSAAQNPRFWLRTSGGVPRGRWNPVLSLQTLRRQHSRAVEIKALELSRERQMRRRDIPSKEVVSRTMLVMLNEAALVLSEPGTTLTAADIDCISVYGFGYPAWKGGICYYADHELGIDRVVSQMMVYNRSLGGASFPRPCKALLEMQSAGETFGQRFGRRATL